MNELLVFDNDMFIKMVIAAGLGALVGLERGFAGKDPSLRTFMIISLGSCLFTLISQSAAASSPGADPARIAAQIITGIGFLGAGTIFRAKDRVMGLTTAALMWTVAAVGMAVGFGRVDIAAGGAFVAMSFMVILKFVHSILDRIAPNRHRHPAATSGAHTQPNTNQN